MDDGRRPRLFQARPGVAVFRGSPTAGGELKCADCGEVLVESIADNALFDVDIVCASCGHVLQLPTFPAGRRLGGVVRHVRRDHHFVGTFQLEMDEVVVGPRAERQRRTETGTPSTFPDSRLLDVAGIEKLIAEARSMFELTVESVPSRRGRSKHPLLRLIRELQENVTALCAGGDEVDVRAAISLQQATAAFKVWARDPSSPRILQESKQPEAFAHNVALLQVASMLEAAGLAPELVPPSKVRTADLILRISASHFVELDIKAPQSMRYPEGQVIRLVEPRRTIKQALRSSRGQFARDGILVIAGEIWFGGIDAYAEIAEHRLHEQLPTDASREARAHYEQLMGIIFAGTGYEEIGDSSFRSRLSMRWVPNPRYAGDIALDLPREVDGRYSIAFSPGSRGTSSSHETTPSPAFNTHHDPSDPPRFSVIASNEIAVEGSIVNQHPVGLPSRSVVCQFPGGHRPFSDIDFDVACETGFTTVTARGDGSLVADPSVGWINLRGIRFTIV